MLNINLYAVKMINKAFVALLLITPAICEATGTLDCSGDNYTVQFHVGSYGLADFTVFGPDGIIAVGSKTNLVNSKLKWVNGENGMHGNHIEMRTKNNFQVPFELQADSEKGRIKIKGITEQITCDWRR